MGLTALAERLGVTPNQVWTWAKRRERNGFPEPVGMRVLKGGKGGRPGPVYDLEAVLHWRAHYVPCKGGQPTHKRGDTNG